MSSWFFLLVKDRLFIPCSNSNSIFVFDGLLQSHQTTNFIGRETNRNDPITRSGGGFLRHWIELFYSPTLGFIFMDKRGIILRFSFL